MSKEKEFDFAGFKISDKNMVFSIRGDKLRRLKELVQKAIDFVHVDTVGTLDALIEIKKIVEEI